MRVGGEGIDQHMKNHRNGSKLLARCEPHFRRLARRLGPKHSGDVVAVEPKTGTCFVGIDTLEVVLKARRAFPRSLFGLFRIGHRTVHKLRRHD